MKSPAQRVSTNKVFGGAWVDGDYDRGCLLAASVEPVEAANKHRLTIYQHGTPVSYLPCDLVGGLRWRTAALMGGSLNVKDAYSWMIDRMTQCKNAGGNLGNFVVIRAGGNPSY